MSGEGQASNAAVTATEADGPRESRELALRPQANVLPIAAGSIGLTRCRCLERLRKPPGEAGYS
jgi:hypothetical protein